MITSHLIDYCHLLDGKFIIWYKNIIESVFKLGVVTLINFNVDFCTYFILNLCFPTFK